MSRSFRSFCINNVLEKNRKNENQGSLLKLVNGEYETDKHVLERRFFEIVRFQKGQQFSFKNCFFHESGLDASDFDETWSKLIPMIPRAQK